MKVYGDSRSGNCYKVRLTAAVLGIPIDWDEVDVLSGRTRSAEFLARNPYGKIPVLQLEDGSYLPESNAIISYLAEGSALLPSESLARARVNQWLFWEQYSHEPNIATVRFWRSLSRTPEAHARQIAQRMPAGRQALQVMDDHLQDRDFFAGDGYTIADIALYAYTHVAGDGGFDLRAYPAVEAWLDRVARQPGHAPMDLSAYAFEPLREFPRTRQIQGEGPRRWWHAPDMDLIVWYATSKHAEPVGFQLCDGPPHRQRSVIWKSEAQLIRERIDDGEDRAARPKGAPISVSDGDTDVRAIADRFQQRGEAVEAPLRDWIVGKLSEPAA